MKAGITLDTTRDTTLEFTVIVLLDNGEKGEVDIVLECDSAGNIAIQNEFQKIILGNSFDEVRESGLLDQKEIMNLITKKVAKNYNKMMQELSEVVLESEEDLLASTIIKGKDTYNDLPIKDKMKILKEVINFQL